MTFPTGAFIMDKLELNSFQFDRVEKSRSLVERARLEIVYTPKGYRGFESPLLRHRKNPLITPIRGFFINFTGRRST